MSISLKYMAEQIEQLGNHPALAGRRNFARECIVDNLSDQQHAAYSFVLFHEDATSHDVANRLGITQQHADKVLLLLYRLRIVERRKEYTRWGRHYCYWQVFEAELPIVFEDAERVT